MPVGRGMKRMAVAVAAAMRAAAAKAVLPLRQVMSADERNWPLKVAMA